MNNKQIQALKEEVERLQKLLKVSGKIEIFEVVAIADSAFQQHSDAERQCGVARVAECGHIKELVSLVVNFVLFKDVSEGMCT